MKNIFHNPVAFTPLPVTIITSLVYVALIVSLLVVHHTVPEAPRHLAGTNLTEAWLDLQTLSNGFHPFNSRRNDYIRDWLLERITAIVTENGVPLVSYPSSGGTLEDVHESLESAPVAIFSDNVSNVSFQFDQKGNAPVPSVYFEGTNIIVYIRGSEDDPDDWFLTNKKPKGKGGVLVNAHYDSVSIGFGATDDGVGVISVLQLIKYFSSKGQTPKKGVVALLNNGEEDYLNGALAFGVHPISKFPHTFLNLEGAGAGGRATLFRSTDTEITRYYQSSKYPFGSVVSGDAFKRGVIRSDTDYSVFTKEYGMRGLDVAFMEPRARYHTSQDDTRHTSKASLHHMLSAALSTMQGLTSDTSTTFEGKAPEKGKVASGKGSSGVWFDFFGNAMAVFRLRTLFALSVTLLVVAPLFLIIIGAILYKVDKLYLFTSYKHHHHAEGDDSVPTKGWRGVFRWPIAFVLATAAIIGLAFLVSDVNPYILSSSQYSVWSMMISAWVFVAWFCTRTADFFRPTAFQRAYNLLWAFIVGWLILIVITVFERNPKLAGGYPMVFYFACIFLATAVAFLEQFSLPRKSAYADEIEGTMPAEHPTERSRHGSISSARLMAPSEEEDVPNNNPEAGEDNDDPTETTSLLRGAGPRTFKKSHTSPHRPAAEDDESPKAKHQRQVYGLEQPWSHALPSSLWLLEFLILAPFPLILLGQLSLLATAATNQTLADGNSPLFLYIGIAILSVLLFAPLGPFLHRYTYHIPLFLMLVFAGTTIYNLTAFPFSANNRLKLYFVQEVDLDSGINTVSLIGIDPETGPFLKDAIASLPSSAGQTPSCTPSKRRRDLTECSWYGLPPRVVPNTHPDIPPEIGYGDWLTFNATRAPDGATSARFRVSGLETRACKILFNRPISDFTVAGADEHSRLRKASEHGATELRWWSRTWEKEIDVTVRWEAGDGDEGDGLDGRVVCLWSDANEPGVIPALDEARRFAPIWVAIANAGQGLVEGSKAFFI
ncbi:MAG: hypothetical protein ASARMPREDX12_008116 [Alectoria sarmentosa]|nr:MAG: hypothetical protein ASARMPREDX12_008116 [Alectoria sarmentosa]